MKDITIDTKKVRPEFVRMMKGEIEFNVDYLNELAEVDGDDVENITLDFQIPRCESCTAVLVYVECHCEGGCDKCFHDGGWMECQQCGGELVEA